MLSNSIEAAFGRDSMRNIQSAARLFLPRCTAYFSFPASGQLIQVPPNVPSALHHPPGSFEVAARLGCFVPSAGQLPGHPLIREGLIVANFPALDFSP